MSTQPLRKIDSIQFTFPEGSNIANDFGQVFNVDIARNGDHFHLVYESSKDAYGNPIMERLSGYERNLYEYLIDYIGELTMKIQGQRDLRVASTSTSREE